MAKQQRTMRVEQKSQLAARFFEAVDQGDVAGLVSMLAADVEVHGDGAGAGISWRKPIVGREHVARLLGALGKQLRAVQGSFRPAEVNGQPGALVLASDGSLIAVLTLDIADGQVQTFRSVIAREKLRHLGPLADIPALIEQRRGADSPGDGDES